MRATIVWKTSIFSKVRHKIRKKLEPLLDISKCQNGNYIKLAYPDTPDACGIFKVSADSNNWPENIISPVNEEEEALMWGQQVRQ